MRSTLRRVVATTTLTAAVAALAVSTGGTSAATPGSLKATGTRGSSDFAAIRAATAKFHDVAAAEAAGYIRVSECEALPGVGVMGFHYLNPVLASDAVIDSTRPEVLLYVPGDEGLKLAGVEYFVAEAAAPSRPSVVGLPFDGPMAGHNLEMPSHYDLHLWIWKHNPSGLAQAWNPTLSC